MLSPISPFKSTLDLMAIFDRFYKAIGIIYVYLTDRVAKLNTVISTLQFITLRSLWLSVSNLPLSGIR